MTLDQLRYALELQRAGNFSRAAEACHITQPSLSVQVAKLEEELGVTLFHRTRSGVEVTEYGEAMLRQARLVLDESNRLQELAAELKGEVQGQFRLGVIPTLAPSLLPLFLSFFGEKYPKVQLSVSEEPTESLVQKIDEGSLDGAILSTPPKCPESLIEKVLFYEPFYVFASSGHPILKSKKVQPSQISAGEILLLDDTHCMRDQVLQLCKLGRGTSDGTNRKLRIQSGSLLTLIEVIRRDPGYTLLPALSTHFLTANERAHNVRHFDKPSPTRKVSLVFHRARLKRSIVEALKESVLQRLPNDVFPPQSGRSIKVLAPGADHFEL